MCTGVGAMSAVNMLPTAHIACRVVVLGKRGSVGGRSSVARNVGPWKSRPACTKNAKNACILARYESCEGRRMGRRTYRCRVTSGFGRFGGQLEGMSWRSWVTLVYVCVVVSANSSGLCCGCVGSTDESMPQSSTLISCDTPGLPMPQTFVDTVSNTISLCTDEN